MVELWYQQSEIKWIELISYYFEVNTENRNSKNLKNESPCQKQSNARPEQSFQLNSNENKCTFEYMWPENSWSDHLVYSRRSGAKILSTSNNPPFSDQIYCAQLFKGILMLSILSKNFSRRQCKILFLIFTENRLWHFMEKVIGYPSWIIFFTHRMLGKKF